jgi:hypothetical protein
MSQKRTGLTENPKLIINLGEVFETDIPNDSTLVNSIGQKIIDMIRERTTVEQTDINGKDFKSPYSKMYADSVEFAAFGKSKNKVNLTQTGDMLGLMDIIDTTKNTITIGWDDDTQAAKASGHITGANHLPKRDFFGLTKDQFNELRAEFEDDIQTTIQADEMPDEDILNLANLNFDLALDLLKAKAITSTKILNVSDSLFQFDAEKYIKSTTGKKR